jgi:hemerythrin-like domain-containing protein
MAQHDGRGLLQRDRRNFIWISAAAGAGLVVSSCQKNGTDAGPKPENGNRQADQKPSPNDEVAPEVTATEDLMREHGVLRRILLVYQAAADNLRTNRLSFPAAPIQDAAKLFRVFGEDYHEKQLEEAYIFPAVKNAGGPGAAAYVDILLAQHQRGREITDYILASTRSGNLLSSSGPQLADALQAYVRMYQNHAAREDTVVFPAWKETLTAAQLDEMNDKFEDIEDQMFGEAGFQEVIKQVGHIEGELGLADLAQFTAPPPPKPPAKTQ